MLSVDVDGMRRAWREERLPSLRRRRTIAALAAAGMADFALISLYQLGLVRHLPDPPGRLFASDQVNSSHKAFAMGVPDGTTGALLYAGTLVLAAFGGTRETGRRPLWSLLLGGAVAAGVVGALDYLRDMIFKQERACPYCLMGAALNFAMVPCVVPEVLSALQ